MVVLLMCSALVSGSEIAYFSLSNADLDELQQSENSIDNKVYKLISKPNTLLATILVGNNFINIGIVILSTFIVDGALNHNALSPQAVIFVQVVVVTFIILLLGEILPKVYASKNGLTLARLMAYPLMVLSKIFYIPNKILLSSTSFIQKRVNNKSSEVTVDELEIALELTEDEETSEEEKKILEGIVKFGNTDVKQIMKPRTDVYAFDITTSFSEVKDEILEIGHSRIPVYEESFDSVKGVLYIKDLLAHIDKEKFDWTKVIRPAFFVPENKKIDDLLKEFQEDKIHIAIVVDEYGGTSGIVTLEDIIEEIIGDISDEFDDDDLSYSKLDENNYVFEGKTPLMDLYRVLDIEGDNFEKVKGESDTIAGFLIEQSGKILLKGEKVVFDEFTFLVESADKRRVKRVKVTFDKEKYLEKNESE